ncbi:MAG TPA: hypothetical protein ENI02_02790 [Candidatus Aminicenantes bacterium]|nr:hypothetical protein [Candidatus Aminicenantes bacterium]
MAEEREFEVGEHMLKSKVNKCMVCLKKLKIGEKIVLCPIQKPRRGWATVLSIPIHTKCFWVED